MKILNLIFEQPKFALTALLMWAFVPLVHWLAFWVVKITFFSPLIPEFVFVGATGWLMVCMIAVFSYYGVAAATLKETVGKSLDEVSNPFRSMRLAPFLIALAFSLVLCFIPVAVLSSATELNPMGEITLILGLPVIWMMTSLSGYMVASVPKTA